MQLNATLREIGHLSDPWMKPKSGRLRLVKNVPCALSRGSQRIFMSAVIRGMRVTFSFAASVTRTVATAWEFSSRQLCKDGTGDRHASQTNGVGCETTAPGSAG